MKKAAGYLGFTVVILLMVAAVFTYVGPHLGWRVDAVLSGSMEPQLKVDSLVVTHSVDPGTIAVGDIVTFRPTTIGENLITHRVIGIEQSSSLYFQTKGDANEDADPFIVPADNLVGKVCFHVPYLGRTTEFIKTPWGYLLAVVIPGLTIITVHSWNIWQTLTKSNRERPDPDKVV